MIRAAYVPQAFFISNNTLLNNIVFGGDKAGVDPLRLEKAIRGAHLEEVIAKLPLGLNTPCGERGINLSGGERQRVAIARALYHEPHLIILDEATSALDEEATSYIGRTITELQGKITSIVISHDRRLFKQCDRIITLEAGRIISEERPGSDAAAKERN